MTSANPAVVGGFILSGLALGVAAILLFGGMRLFSPTVHAVVYFQGSVANLDVGAPVTFRGVRVGMVTKIAVTLNMADLTARIPVYLDLNPAQISLKNAIGEGAEAGLDRLLKAGLRAQLDMQSLVTGQLRVDLDLQPGIAATTLGGDQSRREIPSIPSRLQTLEGEFSELPLKEIAENARKALASIQRVADELPRQIGPLTDSIRQSSDAARVTLENIDQLAVATTRQVTVNGDQLARVLASSDRTVRNTESWVTSMKEMTAPNSQIQSDLHATIRDLAASASSLRGFTHEIERDPSALLSGRTSH
ncbi:MlaD family protein [Telmatospirillum siberiense]|nr:MlaD family protein [Telmatospirillum siberiense]